MSWSSSTSLVKTKTITLTGAQLKNLVGDLTLSYKRIFLMSDFFDKGDLIFGCTGSNITSFGVVGYVTARNTETIVWSFGNLDISTGEPQNTEAPRILKADRDLLVDIQILSGDTFADILDAGSIDITFLAVTP